MPVVQDGIGREGVARGGNGPFQRGIPLVVGILIVALWLALGFWSLSERRRQIEGSEANLRQMTAAVAEQTLRLFKLTETSFLAAEDWLQHNPDPHPSESRDFIALVERLHRLSSGIVEYRFIDADGNLFQIPSPSDAPAGNVADGEGVRIQHDPRTRGFHISNPVVSPIGRKWVVPITYPVFRRDGRPTVMAGVIELDKITALFEAQRQKPSGSITLLKANGVTLFRAPLSEGVIGRSISGSRDFAEHFNVADHGLYYIKGAYDGVERIVGFQNLPEYGLIVATTIPVEDALRSWRRESWTIGGVAALVTALIIVLTARFLRDARRADAALRRREREIASILDASTVGIAFVDNRGAVIRANLRLAEMLACPMDQLVGSRYVDYIAPADRDAAMANIIDLFAGAAEELSVERQYFRRDGGSFWGGLSSRRVLDSTGTCLGVVAVIADITERKAHEDALAAKSRQLETLNQKLKTSNDELETFAYIASHDLREPLRMISSYIGLLERRYGALLDQDGQEFLGFAREGAQRMDRMVLDLLDLSRIGRGEPAMGEMALEPALNGAVINLGALIAETEAVIDVDACLSEARVVGNPVQIGRLFQNLIGNALKYRSPDCRPEIRVSCRRTDAAWEIAVADNGIGIDGAYFDRIFGIFQRLHRREDYEGTGIGLAVCKKIVEHHGGRIWVESQPGLGSTFFFTLPRG